MNLAIVLHAHLPYVRHPQHEQFLEEYWFYEAMIECYLPLLDVMKRLLEDGVRFRLAMNLSPTLLAMMRDPLLIARFRRRMELLLDLCDREAANRSGGEQRLARMYRARWRRLVALFDRFCRQDLVAGFSRIQEEGALEILACPATHGFLPFLAVTPHAARAQIAIGVAEYRRHFRRDPKGLWLPECAYAPGLDAMLDQHHLRYFLLDTHGFRNGTPPPRHDTRLPARTPAGLAFFGRDEASAKQVWSSTEGYPGDYWYREFYRDIGHTRPLRSVQRFLPAGIRFDTGLKYWRVTGKREDKALYDRSRAMQRVRTHAEHFVAQRIAQLQIGPRGAIAVTPYDAELFGHWWYEGPEWIETVLRMAEGRLRTVTPSEYLEDFPPRQVCAPHFSSWGEHGYGDVWLNPQTDWIYPKLHRMAEAMGEMARIEQPGPLLRRALNQAGRELLLAQASDWPFLIRRGGAPHYAESRLREHMANFESLERGIRRRRVPRAQLQAMEQQWCLFPEIDYRVWAAAP
jgi:1,4-alpha-glucan branching enzyme